MRNEEILNSPGQALISECIKTLPDEVVSMSWRSQLNERVKREAKLLQRRRRILWVVQPVAGMGLAFALAAVVFFRPQGTVTSAPPSSHLESGIVALHQEAARTPDLVGVGLTPAESTETSKSAVASDWTESDVDGL